MRGFSRDSGRFGGLKGLNGLKGLKGLKGFKELKCGAFLGIRGGLED